ncbi:MAG TPA: hypothetical protein VM791_15695 [Vicinamibacterales bacterium]|jgi:hypothetical protein|nr:hypothetical protein [Vicinamibacterales bacterium]
MRLWAGIAVGLLLASGQQSVEQRFSKAEGDRFQVKLSKIVAVGNTPRGGKRAAQSTVVSDVEVTSYLRFHARDQVPVGIVDPVLNAQAEGIVAGRAIVDLDAVRKQKERGWLDPMGYLTGRLPLNVRGRLTTQNGVGRFILESAELSGMTVPKSLVQELLTFYSRTPEDPDGINMDDPFELPAQIREIRVTPGTATIVQ